MRITVIVLLALISGILGCAPSDVRIYGGPALAPSQEVTLSPTDSTLVVRVDGQKTKGAKLIRLEPGKHEVELKYDVSTNSGRYRNDREMRFNPDFKPGQHYVATAVGLEERILAGILPGPQTLQQFVREMMDKGDRPMPCSLVYRSPEIELGSGTVVGVAYARHAPALYVLGEVILLRKNPKTARWCGQVGQPYRYSLFSTPHVQSHQFPIEPTRFRISAINQMPADVKPYAFIVKTTDRGGFTLRNVPAGDYYLMSLFNLEYPSVQSRGTVKEITIRDGELTAGHDLYANFGPKE